MELFAGDGGISNAEEAFPDQVAPFPVSTDLIYVHTMAAIQSPELVAQGQGLPPQKLRPIRCCNGRSLDNLTGTIGRFSPEEEVGFLSGPVNEVPGDFFEAPLEVEVGGAVTSGGGAFLGDYPERVVSGAGGDEWGPNCEDYDNESR